MKYFNQLCKLATKAIIKYNMIEANDKLLIGLSGGKDSFVLAHVLYHLQRRSPIKFEIKCCTFDPGFDGFNFEAIKKYANEMNWQLHKVSLPIAKIIQEKDFKQTPCVLCSRLRRGKLYGMAKQLNCNKLVLGHHFDDIAISFLMSFFRGQGLTSMSPNVLAQSENAIQIIRPLSLAKESLIIKVQDELNFPIVGKCKYKDLLENKDRKYFKNMLENLSNDIPNLHSQMLYSLSNIEPEFLLDPKYISHLN